MCCDEIYFTTEGVCGSVTMIAGNAAVQGDTQERWTQKFVDLVTSRGYSEHIGRAMTASRYMCSYDKNEDTGEVTFYGDLSGEYILSDDKSNLCFNSSNALHCGFSKGTADTEEELAALLQLPKWREVDDYGRRIAEDWQATIERADREIPRLIRDRQLKNTAGTTVQRLGTLIQVNKKLIRWIEIAPMYCLTRLQPKEVLEQEIEQWRRELANLNR
jgi:hypothetical protein